MAYLIFGLELRNDIIVVILSVLKSSIWVWVKVPQGAIS